MKTMKAKPSYIQLFLAVAMIGLFSSLVLWITGVVPFEQSILSSDNLFSDYFSHIGYGMNPREVYRMSESAVFPPLAYLFYYLMGRLDPVLGVDPLNWGQIKDSGDNLLIFLMYSIFIALILTECVRMYLKNSVSELKTLWIAMLMIGSYPYMCTSLQRGNIVALISVLIGIALLWMDSENAVKREAALILIAVAACFKVTPLLLGIWYLINRRYRELLRLILYTAVLFIVPFLFFGGYEGFISFLGNLRHTADKEEWNWGTVRGFVYFVTDGHVSYAHRVFLGYFGEILFLIVCILCAWIGSDHWRRVFFLCAVLVSYLPSNYIYTLAYLLPPTLLFLRDVGNRKAETFSDTVAALGFGLIFSLQSWMDLVFEEGMREGFSITLYIVVSVLAIDTILRRIRQHPFRT